jgi:hypothetical protein
MQGRARGTHAITIAASIATYVPVAESAIYQHFKRRGAFLADEACFAFAKRQSDVTEVVFAGTIGGWRWPFISDPDDLAEEIIGNLKAGLNSFRQVLAGLNKAA